MKTLRILTLAAAALISAACGNEDFLENPGNEAAKPVLMTFTADVPQTRTQLDGHDVHWVKYDEIALWDGSEAYQKLMVDAESINGSSATFSGPAIPGADYTAFYPLIAVESMNATSIRFNLPAEQTAVAGTFANQLAPALARATGGSTNLVFDNLCALVKFTAGADMAGEGTFTLVGGNATEALAGKLTCNTADGTLTATEPATRITLKGTFESGQAYYFVVMPGTLANGFSLLYEDSKSKLYRKATGNSVTLQAGHILNLGTLALTGFEPAVTTGMTYLNTPIGTPHPDGTSTLNASELGNVGNTSSLRVPSKSLTSLAGVGHYTSITTLYCDYNQLTTLNASGLAELQTLVCNDNQLTTLNVSGLTKLETLHCYKNQLTTLNAGGLTELDDLLCNDNQLTALSLSGSTKLGRLQCYNNKLATLDVSQLTKLTTLKCYNNQLTTLNFDGLTGLEYLDCGYNQLTSLDVSQLTSLTTLKCYSNQLTSLDVSKLTQLTDLNCRSNLLTALDITPLTGLTTLVCGYQDYGNLNLVLTLTSAQETMWYSTWLSSEYYNTRNVTLDVKP